MGKFLLAALIGAFVGDLVGGTLQSDRAFLTEQQAMNAMVYPITGAFIGASCVWLTRWERSRRK